MSLSGLFLFKEYINPINMLILLTRQFKEQENSTNMNASILGIFQIKEQTNFRNYSFIGIFPFCIDIGIRIADEAKTGPGWYIANEG